MNTVDIVQALRAHKIGVMPTDTLYGLVGSALDEISVERMYRIKGRDTHKPFVILIARREDISLFTDNIPDCAKTLMETHWPGPLTVIVPVLGEEYAYLHRGTYSLGFRVPDNSELRDMLSQTGPLVAPSANPQSVTPAKNGKQAQDYFGDTVDFYVDGSDIQGEPSTLVDCTGKTCTVVRHGAIQLDI